MVKSDKRITNRSDLHYFIHLDRIANKYDSGNAKQCIKQLFWPNLIIRYLKALRMAEYYTNVGGIFHAPFKIYWLRKLKKMGLLLGFSIPPNTCGPGLSLPHYGNIIINPNARLGAYCRIHSGVNIGASGGSKVAPQIGDCVYIAPGAILFGDIQIGNNNCIGV